MPLHTIWGGKIVDFGGITSIDRKVNKGESYLFTSPNEHHAGISSDAMRLLCRYGFEELGLNKLYAFTNEDNTASFRLHEKVGYKLEGRLREEYALADGTRKYRLYHGLLKSDYLLLKDSDIIPQVGGE